MSSSVSVGSASRLRAAPAVIARSNTAEGPPRIFWCWFKRCCSATTAGEMHQKIEKIHAAAAAPNHSLSDKAEGIQSYKSTDPSFAPMRFDGCRKLPPPQQHSFIRLSLTCFLSIKNPEGSARLIVGAARRIMLAAAHALVIDLGVAAVAAATAPKNRTVAWAFTPFHRHPPLPYDTISIALFYCTLGLQRRPHLSLLLCWLYVDRAVPFAPS